MAMSPERGCMTRIAAILMLVLILCAAHAPVEAQMQMLAANEMADITGGFGFTIPAGETVGLVMSIDKLYYYDDDGTGGASQGAYLTLCGLKMDGSIAMGSAVSMGFGNFASLINGSQVTGIDIFLDDMTLKIDNFQIDAIRVGSEPGAGPSYGAIGMQNFTLQMSGKVQIYTH